MRDRQSHPLLERAVNERVTIPETSSDTGGAESPARQTDSAGLEKLPLDGWHRSKGARMVPFAGYEMPVQYEGIIAEHLWTRENAGLFDVSHMGQLLVHGRSVDAALEKLMPVGFPGRSRHEAQIFASPRRRGRDH